MSDWHIWGESAAADRVRALVSGLPNDKSRLRNIMVVQAFIDDSADGNRNKVFTLAGYVATAEAWVALAKEWEKQLEGWRLPYFKLSEMPADRPEVIASFYRIIENHDIPVSIDCAVEIPTWKKVVNEIPWTPKLMYLKKLIGNPYFIVSKKLMRGLYDYADELGFQEPIDFIFDDQIGEKRVVLDAWEYFKHTANEELRKRMGDYPSFKSDDAIKPLQAADLIAGYVRKSIEQNRDSQNGADILPWKCKKTIKRLMMRFTEEHLRNELQWILSPENVENTKAFYQDEASLVGQSS